MKKKWIFLILIPALLFLSACGEADRTYEKAEDLYLSGKYSEAADAYILSISQGKKEAIVYSDIALCYSKLGDDVQAESYLGTALDMDGSDPEILKRAGLVKRARGNDTEALEYFRRSLRSSEDKLSKTDMETVAFIAETEARIGSPEEAVRLYGLLIEQKYYPMEHQYLSGLAYLSMHQTEAAEQFFILFAAHKEAPAEMFLNIYQGYLEEDEPSRAEQWFSEGLNHIRADGGVTEAVYYARAGKTGEAMELFKEETTASGLLDYSKCLSSAGRYDEAEEVILRVIGSGELLPEAYYEYLLLKIRTGETEDAERLFTQVRSYNVQELSEALDWNEVIMYEQNGDFMEAYRLLTNYAVKYGGDQRTLQEYAFLSRVSLTE